MARNRRRRDLASRTTLRASTGVFFGLLAATCWGVADYFVAVYARKIGWFKTLVWMSLSAAIAFTAVYAVWRPKIEIAGADWILLVGWALLVLPNYAAFYRALELGPIAIVTPVVAAYAAVVVVLSLIFLKEDLNLVQGSGIILAIVGVMLASADLRRLKPGTRRIGPGVWFGLASMVGFGVGSFAGGVFSRTYGWFLPAFFVRLFITGMLVPMAAKNQSWPWRSLERKSLLALSFFGVLEASGFFAFTRGAELGLVSVVAAASASYPLIPLALGIARFRERPAPNQLVGIAAVLSGVVVLAVSG